MFEGFLLSFFLNQNQSFPISMDHRTFTVEGIVKKYVGNQMNYKRLNPNNEEPYKLIAIEGVYPHEGKTDFEMNSLDSFYKIINTKENGTFKVELKSGKYTFFILKGDRVYLNNFDGLGNYSHIEVKEHIKKLIIRDDLDANF